jgi:ribosomal protein S18 acetylase RimI-like enzyme
VIDRASSEPLDIQQATDDERNWAAHLIATSEPWITLKTTVEQSIKICRDPEYMTYIAHFGGQPCGAIILHPRGLASSPYIKTVVVAEAFRSRGVGAGMIGFAEKHFRKSSKHLFLCVSSFNKKARTFYAGLGYLPVGEFKDFVIEGESELLLYKRLR